MQSSLPELAIQYADYAVWQRQWLQGKVLEKQLSYWKKKLEGFPSALQLPADRARSAIKSYRAATERIVIRTNLCDKLKSLSQRAGTTLFMSLLSGFKVLLSRYTGQHDI